jgi:hypothetical protein
LSFIATYNIRSLKQDYEKIWFCAKKMTTLPCPIFSFFDGTLTLKEVEHDARGSSLLMAPPARQLDSGEPPLEDPDHDMEDQAVLREDREMEINTAAVAKALQGDR